MHTELREEQEQGPGSDIAGQQLNEKEVEKSERQPKIMDKQVQCVISNTCKQKLQQNENICMKDKVAYDGFFQEQSSFPAQKGLFKRTYSFYEQNTIEPMKKHDQEQVRDHNIQELMQANDKAKQNDLELDEPKITSKEQGICASEEVQVNKYSKYLTSAKECLEVLKLGYYFSALRVLFIFLIFYQFDFIIPKYPKKEDNKQIYEPWNILVYLISGCIQFIAMIGFISSMRILKSDIKVLGKKHKKEEQKIKRERYLLEIKRKRQYKYSKEDQQFMNELNMTEANAIQVEVQDLHEGNEINQNREQRQRILRQGNRLYMPKRSTYRSVYNAILQFKYKDKEQSNPFKICKWIHIFGTFLFFGRFALIQFFQIQKEWQKVNGQNPNTEREVVLWIFLLTAYLSSFQIDLRNIEGSTGPFIKIQKFFTSKIYKIYCQFFRWRRHYSAILKIGITAASICLICDFLIPHIRGGKQLCLSVLVFKVLLIVTSIVNLIYNKNTILAAKQYIQGVPQCSINNLQMANHKNLSILGVFHRHCHISYTYFLSFHRIIIFLFGIALLKISDQEDEFFLTFLINIVVFLVYVSAEVKKFYVFNDSEVNLFDVWKFKDFCNISQNSELALLDENKQKEPKVTEQLMNGPIKNSTLNANHNNQIFYNNCCSICLQQYQGQQNIIIVCCGHIFHQPCLMLWIKTKKQCAFCRFNLDEFYQDVSF